MQDILRGFFIGYVFAFMGTTAIYLIIRLREYENKMKDRLWLRAQLNYLRDDDLRQMFRGEDLDAED